jgi:hypothetical protein
MELIDEKKKYIEKSRGTFPLRVFVAICPLSAMSEWRKPISVRRSPQQETRENY